MSFGRWFMVVGPILLGWFLANRFMLGPALDWVFPPRPHHDSVSDSVAYLGGFGVFVAAWIGARRFWAPLIKLEGGTLGTAHFSDQRERAALHSAAGVVVGRDPEAPALLRFDRPGHLLTCAPTRTGKGVSAVIPNLLDYPGSVVCLDVKGENTAVTARARRDMGQAVHVLDPFDVTGQHSGGFNPMAGLDPAHEDCIDDAAILAGMLVVPAASANDSHWDDEARAVLQGLCLYAATLEPARRTLGTVRELVTLPPDDFAALLDDMVASRAAFGMIARTAAKLLGKDSRERAGVMSTAQRHTAFLDSPRIQRVLSSSSFDFAGLKDGRTSVYLVLPAERLNAYRGWLRVLIGAALVAISRDRRPAAFPVLWLLDEFPALGRMEALETAVGLMAGYGVKMWTFVQDLAQLKGTYQKWETFLSNAAVLQTFGVNDVFTADYVSKMTGDTTVEASGRTSGGKGGSTESKTQHARRLLTPDEVRRLPASKSLVFVQGRAPIQARKVNYLTDAEYAGRFDPNPFHG